MTKNKWLLILLIGLGLALAGCGLREGTIVYDTGYPTIDGDSDGGGGSGGGSGDITAVIAGDGIDGGAFSGTATVNLDTGSAHFTNGVLDLALFQETGSVFTAHSSIGVTGSLTIQKDDSGDALSIYSGSVKTFGITGDGLLKMVTQSAVPTATPGALYLDENYNLFIGSE